MKLCEIFGKLCALTDLPLLLPPGTAQGGVAYNFAGVRLRRNIG